MGIVGSAIAAMGEAMVHSHLGGNVVPIGHLLTGAGTYIKGTSSAVAYHDMSFGHIFGGVLGGLAGGSLLALAAQSSLVAAFMVPAFLAIAPPAMLPLLAAGFFVGAALLGGIAGNWLGGLLAISFNRPSSGS